MLSHVLKNLDRTNHNSSFFTNIELEYWKHQHFHDINPRNPRHPHDQTVKKIDELPVRKWLLEFLFFSSK